MNVKCLLGLHEPELYDSETGSAISFSYWICKNCDRKQVTLLGCGGMKNGNWKRKWETSPRKAICVKGKALGCGCIYCRREEIIASIKRQGQNIRLAFEKTTNQSQQNLSNERIK